MNLSALAGNSCMYVVKRLVNLCKAELWRSDYERDPLAFVGY